MDKQADQMRQAHPEKLRPDVQKEAPQKNNVAMAFLPALRMGTGADIPLLELDTEMATELASKLGNAALCELLGAGVGAETASFRLPAGGELPENPANAAPPELTNPSGLQYAGLARHPFEPGAMLGRMAPAQGINIFIAAMGGEM